MDIKYPHLKLKEWPFQVVPDERFQRIWADRREVLADINLILDGLSRREASTINLLWAWYGAGKSHTLRHMEYLCHSRFTKILPVYMELPRKINSFLDLYVSFIEAIGKETIAKMAQEVYVRNEDFSGAKKIAAIYEEFSQILVMLISEEENKQSLAWRWLAVKNVRIGDYRSFGIFKKIEDSDMAVKALSAVVCLLRMSGNFSRVVWMIDEFQRLARLPKNVFADVNAGLHSVFNAAPLAFSLLLSFSVHSEDQMFSLLSKELLDRIGISKVIQIPKMDERESLTFLADLLYEFRPSLEDLPAEYFPFTEEAARYVLFMIGQKTELKPRSIMQYFNVALERAEPLLQIGEIKEIDLEFVKRIFSEKEVVYFVAEEARV